MKLCDCLLEMEIRVSICIYVHVHVHVQHMVGKLIKYMDSTMGVYQNSSFFFLFGGEYG